MSERNDRRSAGRADRTTEHDAVIERLRSALEEVAMGAELGTGPGVVDVRPAGSVTGSSAAPSTNCTTRQGPSPS